MVKMNRLDEYRVEIPQHGGMRVPGVIYSTKAMMEQIESDDAPQQVINVAHLPGIVKASFAMPDIHWGYGFPIGGVAAFDLKSGIISPGGVGYDINCGVRLATMDLSGRDIKKFLPSLIDELYTGVPCGVGRGGDLRLGRKEIKKVLTDGAAWAVSNGFGDREDLEHIENGGRMVNADPDSVSKKAYERGNDQIGTLGSGNHFLEIGMVEEIFNPEVADVFGLAEGQITLMIHSGSRGLGYQVCDDYLARMMTYVVKEKIKIPDRQLACAHFESHVGREYFSAMAAAANFAWANRQVLMSLAGDIIARSLGVSLGRLGYSLLYDVCHNIAKVEKHTVDGKPKQVVVHRKGATRAFGPGAQDLSEIYKNTGQPVLIPGDMGRASYVLVGTQKAMDETFGSSCHGAGRMLSRKAAVRKARGRRIDEELASQGVVVRSRGRTTLSEEMPEAYKDVSAVVEVVHGAGIASKVARIKPLGVIKG